jgi:hypothetical protein
MVQLRTIISAFVCAAMCATSPLQGRAFAASAQMGECREPISFPIFDAEKGSLYDGVFSLCRGGIADQTQGPNALAAGQSVFYVPGRYLTGELKVGAFVRAFPNRAYPIHPDAARVQDGSTVFWRVTPRTSWEGVPVVPPFIPATTAVVGNLGPGKEIYGYTDLVPLPGYESAMAPLNSHSVIYSVGGVSFAESNGLQAWLGDLKPSKTWAEVLYIQSDEPRVQIRRAFVPLIPRSEASANWATLAQQHPLSKSNDHSTLERYAVFGLALAALGLAKGMADSGPHCRWVDIGGQNNQYTSVQKCD